jgi:hypothetical protein
VTFDESLFMSMWARLGRFLEIYCPKFLDFQRKSDFHWKSSDYETQLKILILDSMANNFLKIVNPFKLSRSIVSCDKHISNVFIVSVTWCVLMPSYFASINFGNSIKI